MALGDRVVVVANGDYTGKVGTVMDYESTGQVSVHLDHPANEACDRRPFWRTDLAVVKTNPHLT